ncbi:glycosyltransferase [Demequina maris]|uniref:glycosyltransferase n=1 Tax=Demequina maris TaxID=1638982 RepID=UPI00078128D9|nr:glycosyltransferase [Demequina maris]
MRILHIAPGTSRRLGGPTTLLRGLVPVQKARGHQVSIVATDLLAESDEDRRVPGADVTLIPLLGPGQWAYGRGLHKAIKEAVAQSDLVHIHGVYSFASVFGMREAHRQGVPFLAAPHGVWTPDHHPRHPAMNAVWDKVMLGPTLKNAHVVVSDSKRDEGYLRERGYARTDTMVLGVDPELHKIDTPWKDRKGVLFISRVAPKKRLDLALKAYAASGLKDRGHDMTVGGPIEPGLSFDPHALVEELGIADHVTFVGTVEEDMRRELLRTHRVFILASDDESFGIAVAEAASAGLGVVTSDRVVAMLEAEHDGAARTFPQDVDKLAAGLSTAARDDAGPAAATLCEYARERWTWEHAAQQIEDMVATPQTGAPQHAA